MSGNGGCSYLEAVDVFDRRGHLTETLRVSPVTAATSDGFCVSRRLNELKRLGLRYLWRETFINVWAGPEARQVIKEKPSTFKSRSSSALHHGRKAIPSPAAS